MMSIIRKSIKRITGIIKGVVSKFGFKFRLIKFASIANIHKSVLIFKESAIINQTGVKDNIFIGEGTCIRGTLQAYPIGGKIHIGKNCYIGDMTRIWSMSSVEIQDNVLISHNVNIHDNNSHSTNYEIRKNELAYIIKNGSPRKNIFNVKIDKIVIEEGAWIGFNASILKGVKIGKGAIVAAGSIVTKDVPPYSVVAGVPAVVVKKAEGE